jgi:alanine dehydrogenase
LGLIGSGRQAQTQVRATALECEIDQIKVWSRDQNNAEKLCRMFPEFDCIPVTAEQACDCDLLVTTTPSRIPVVQDDWISPGTHINAIGADGAGKQELDPALLSRATVIVDDPAQAIHSGEINVPIRDGQFVPEQIAGILGEYVVGTKKRISQDEITIFDSTGLAIQDLAIAKIAIENKNRTKLPFP